MSKASILSREGRLGSLSLFNACKNKRAQEKWIKSTNAVDNRGSEEEKYSRRILMFGARKIIHLVTVSIKAKKSSPFLRRDDKTSGVDMLSIYYAGVKSNT